MPSACPDEQTLLAFFEGGLQPVDLPALDAHLAGCADCASVVAAAARAAGSLRPAPVGPGCVLRGTYRLERSIGLGGMGEVFEARHIRLKGRFAVKLLHRDVDTDPGLLERFRREAELSSSLTHPNIVQVVDFNETPDGKPYLVMEYLDGPTLAALLSERGKLPLALVMDLARQMASALAAVHAKNIVHRDLKPSNVFVLPPVDEGQPRVKLVDFGLSKVMGDSAALTRQTTVLGTPQYMAPEQAQGRAAEIDGRSDQFALAAILYEMLSGRPAFAADTISAVLYKIVHEQPAPLQQLVTELPGRMAAAIDRALSKAREARFPAIEAFHAELVAPQQTGQHTPQSGRTGARTLGARAVKRAALVLVGTAVLALAVHAWRREPAPTRPAAAQSGSAPAPVPVAPPPVPAPAVGPAAALPPAVAPKAARPRPATRKRSSAPLLFDRL